MNAAGGEFDRRVYQDPLIPRSSLSAFRHDGQPAPRRQPAQPRYAPPHGANGGPPRRLRTGMDVYAASPLTAAQQARRRLAGLLLAYSFCGRRGSEGAAEYAAEYGKASLRDKLRTAARQAGSAVVERALALRDVAVSEQTPAWARECAHAALGYFIVPMDAIPDAAPAGFCDDLAVLATALGAVAAYVPPAIRARAERKARKVCGLAESPRDALKRPPAAL